MSVEESKHAPPEAVVGDEDLQLIQSLIGTHNDFPLKGIVFRDIFPVLLNHHAAERLYQKLADHVASLGKIDVIVGLDARGFIFGPIVASRIGAGFAPIRKAGKLPGECHQVSYGKEYGKDVCELQTGAVAKGQKVVVIDDLLATGGTLKGACELLDKVGAEIVECVVVIELDELNGRKAIPYPVWSLLHY